MADFLTDADRRQIVAAIREVEAKSDAELVAVVARESDRYGYIPVLWAALLALLGAPLALALDPGLPIAYLALGQLGAFVLLALLGQIGAIRYAVVPPSVKRMRAARLAREQFLLQGVANTAHRSGVLIFVSVAERHVEIIADSGIGRRVTDAVWQKAIDGFVAHVAAGKVAEGFLSAIAQCGSVLVEHFPAPARNPDELPNHLVEL